MSGNDAANRRAAFRKTYETHKERLLTLAVALTGDRHSGEDVLHGVFSSLWQDGRRLRDGAGIGSYLAVCVRNRAIDLLRKGKRRAQSAVQLETGVRQQRPEDPVESVVKDETAERLLASVAQLPDPLREVLSLRIWADMSFDEIAGLQAVSKSTAHGRYQEALQTLRGRIGGER